MLEKLKAILYEYTGDCGADINEDTVLIADLGLSSLDLVDMACTVEEEFAIEIPDRVIRDFRTIGDVLLFIDGQIKDDSE